MKEAILQTWRKLAKSAARTLLMVSLTGWLCGSAGAVNYLKISSSGNAADSSLYLQIVSTSPGLTYVHYFGVPFLLVPPAHRNFYACGYNSGYDAGGTFATTIYVAGVPSSLTITNMSNGATTTVGSTQVAFAGRPLFVFPDGLLVGPTTPGYYYADSGCTQNNNYYLAAMQGIVAHGFGASDSNGTVEIHDAGIIPQGGGVALASFIYMCNWGGGCWWQEQDWFNQVPNYAIGY